MFNLFKKQKKEEPVVEPNTTQQTIDVNIPTADNNGNITITSEPIVEQPKTEETVNVESAPQPAVKVAPAPSAVNPVNAETVTPVTDNIVEEVPTQVTNPTAEIQNETVVPQEPIPENSTQTTESKVEAQNEEVASPSPVPEVSAAPAVSQAPTEEQVAAEPTPAQEQIPEAKEEQPIQVEAAPASAPTESKTETNKFCPNCGNMEPYESIICSNCGSRL